MKNNNYLWQKFYGENEYNIQTIDKKIHAKLSRRKKFKLILHGINKKIWVYKVRFKSPKIARKSFSSGVIGDSPFGVTLPTRISPGPTSAPP